MRWGVVFPGQGSQDVGMGCEIAQRSAAARDIFQRANAVLGYDLLALQQNGPEDKLRETEYSQPAIFVTNVALYAAIDAPLQPVVTAGHSFGELCSLVVAKALDFEEALRIVNERGKAMQEAAMLARGGMSAVLGLQSQEVGAVLDRIRNDRDGRVTMANFNSPTQVVISGDVAAVAGAVQPMLDAGAKRVIPLNVSGAWHSSLMQPAVERLSAAVQRAHFAMPVFDVVSNVDAQPYRSVDTIKQNLVRSIVQEVRWHETAEQLLSYELDIVVECGANNVLGALLKRMPSPVAVSVVSESSGVAKLRAQLDAAAGARV